MDLTLPDSHEFRYAQNWWRDAIPDSSTTPISYIELGAHRGYNIVSVAKTYAQHPDSKIYAVDKWTDEQQEVYDFSQALFQSQGISDKVTAIKGDFETVLTGFADETFDIVMIDSIDHDKLSLYSQLAAKKVKKGGYIVFDDTHDHEVCAPIDAVYTLPDSDVTIVQNRNSQRYYKRNL